MCQRINIPNLETYFSEEPFDSVHHRLVQKQRIFVSLLDTPLNAESPQLHWAQVGNALPSAFAKLDARGENHPRYRRTNFYELARK